MAQTLQLGVGTTGTLGSGATERSYINWAPAGSRLLIDAAFAAASPTYLVSLDVASDGRVAIHLEKTDTFTSIGTRGFIDAFETHGRLTFRAGAQTLVVDGIGDSDEPYNWVAANAAAVAAFISGYGGEAATLELDIPPLDVAASAAGGMAGTLAGAVELGAPPAYAEASFAGGLDGAAAGRVELGDTPPLHVAASFAGGLAGTLAGTIERVPAPLDIRASFAGGLAGTVAGAVELGAPPIYIEASLSGGLDGAVTGVVELAAPPPLDIKVSFAGGLTGRLAGALELGAPPWLDIAASFEGALFATIHGHGFLGLGAIPDLPIPLVHWLAEFPTSEPGYRFWSGDEDLELGGKTYQGRNFISLSGAEAATGAPRHRMSASFAVPTPALRLAFMQDPGPLTVIIEWLVSLDQGLTWRKVPRKFVGRLSKPLIKDGIYTIEIETYGGDVDRGRPLKWSNEDQQARHPGEKGLEYVRQLSDGLRDQRWPP